MRAPHPLLSALLLFAAIPAVHAAAGEAAGWTPPTLTPNSPAPTTHPPEAPALAATASIATTAPAAESPVATASRRPRAAHKSCKHGKARCHSRRADPRLVTASTQRARLLAMAEPLLAAGRADDAARILSGAGAAHGDPILYLAAAQAELSGPRIDDERLTRALQLTNEAQRLITTPIDLRFTVGEGPALTAEAQALTTYVTRRQTQLRRQRRGKAELACGATFLALGATGLGMLASGAALTSRIDAARNAYTGQDPAYQASLKSSEHRAGTLLTAGLLSGLFGAALGIPLTIAGARDLKRARTSGPERPNFRLAPGFAGVSISGKF